MFWLYRGRELEFENNILVAKECSVGPPLVGKVSKICDCLTEHKSVRGCWLKNLEKKLSLFDGRQVCEGVVGLQKL